MIKPIVRDAFFLNQKSEEATKADLPVVQDLEDTLKANRERCVGMAANMIGVCKRIIAFNNEGKYEVMLNPKIVKASGEYETKEGCLSLLEDPRPTKRFQKIKVEYQTMDMKVRLKTYEGFTAQIIQHEIDHCNGILI
jgi:peptide deformylase